MAKMITLTQPDGKGIEVDLEKMSVLRANFGEFTMRANSIIRIDGENHAVIETIAQIKALKA